jgi:hypothetical protein
MSKKARIIDLLWHIADKYNRENSHKDVLTVNIYMNTSTELLNGLFQSLDDVIYICVMRSKS